MPGNGKTSVDVCIASTLTPPSLSVRLEVFALKMHPPLLVRKGIGEVRGLIEKETDAPRLNPSI